MEAKRVGQQPDIVFPIEIISFGFPTGAAVRLSRAIPRETHLAAWKGMAAHAIRPPMALPKNMAPMGVGGKVRVKPVREHRVLGLRGDEMEPG